MLFLKSLGGRSPLQQDVHFPGNQRFCLGERLSQPQSCKARAPPRTSCLPRFQVDEGGGAACSGARRRTGVQRNHSRSRRGLPILPPSAPPVAGRLGTRLQLHRPWTRFQRLCNPSLSLPFSNARAACLWSGSQAPGERKRVQETLGVAVAGSATFPRLGWKLSSWLPERLGRLWVPPPGVHAPLTLPYPQLPRPGGSPILSCPGNSHSSVLPHS